MKRITCVLMFCFLLRQGSAQQTINVQPGVNLPKDSLTRLMLLTSVNGLLAEREKAAADNHFAQKETGTALLLEEMQGMEKSIKFGSDTFYKPYLMNVSRSRDSTYEVQIAYMGLNEGRPLTRALFTLRARKLTDRFVFASPLAVRAATWKMKTFANTRFFYKHDIHTANAKKYLELVTAYDATLGAGATAMDFYCCDDFHEALSLMGVDYKSDYNGYSKSGLSGREGDRSISVNGAFTSEFTDVDPHDLWHSRLHLVMPVAVINRPVDEGTAYLYGGSWGLSWQEILSCFLAYAAANPLADWRALYNESRNFDEKGEYPLNVDYVINALIAKKLEKEKGFPAVMELLRCGKKEKENENYFRALERIAGISQENFNESIRRLIAENQLKKG